MTKLGFKLLFLIASICTSNLCAAADVEDVSSRFKSYTTRMQDQKLPLTLIVGCGHGTYYKDGDHTHPDSWCVNMATDPSLKGFPNNTEERFRDDIQYDEILDITMSDPSHYSRYKGMFDVILLERPLPITLNKPWTLWNAAYMLKEGGELIIDSTMGYSSELYEKNTWLGAACSSENQDYPVNQCPEKLKKFGISGTTPRVHEEMTGISNFLNFWSFKDIVNVGDKYNTRYHAYQPYTKTPGQSVETARKTCILSATKTPETESKMESWAKVINPLWTGVREKATETPILPMPITAHKSERQSEKATESVNAIKPENFSPKKEEIAKTSSKPIMEPNIVAEKASSNPIVEVKRENPTIERQKGTFNRYYEPGYREVQLPSLAQIKEDLLIGKSLIFSETGDLFYVQSILGTFFGFTPEAQETGFDLKIPYVYFSDASFFNRFEKRYQLTARLNVYFNKIQDGNEKKIPVILMLKHDGHYPHYLVRGGTEERRGNLRIFTRLPQIMAPLKTQKEH